MVEVKNKTVASYELNFTGGFNSLGSSGLGVGALSSTSGLYTELDDES